MGVSLRLFLELVAARSIGAAVTLVLALPVAGATAAEVRVIDGDTVRIGREKVRLADANAPELHFPGCAKELHLAREARSTLERLVRSGTVTVERQGFDRRGRMEAIVRVDGVSVGSLLVARGLAQPRQGTGSRRKWCVDR